VDFIRNRCHAPTFKGPRSSETRELAGRGSARHVAVRPTWQTWARASQGCQSTGNTHLHIGRLMNPDNGFGRPNDDHGQVMQPRTMHDHFHRRTLAMWSKRATIATRNVHLVLITREPNVERATAVESNMHRTTQESLKSPNEQPPHRPRATADGSYN